MRNLKNSNYLRVSKSIQVVPNGGRRTEEADRGSLWMRQFVVGDSVSVGDFVMAYTLDWGDEAKLLDGCPQLLAYMKRMYARPHAPLRIAEAFAAISSEDNFARGDG
jgi:glutathione S-transferase